MRAYSRDLRERALADCDAGPSNDEVAREFSVSASWSRRLKQRRRETGSIDPRPRRSPTSRLLAHGPRIYELVQQQPDATLAELRQALGVPTSVSALCRALQRLRLAFKKKRSVPHGHWKTTTLIAALRSTGMTAPMVIDGAINGDLFCAYGERVLVPELQTGDIVMLDDLSSQRLTFGLRMRLI
jgi:transposase